MRKFLDRIKRSFRAGKSRLFMSKNVQAFIFTIRGFERQRVGREAIALSQFTLIAFVPIFALLLFFASGFNLDRILYDKLAGLFPTSMPLVDSIVELAQNIINATENGLFGWISFLGFAWTVIWLMINIEVAFNRVWRVQRPRKLWKRVAVYAAILIATPFVLVLFLSGWTWHVRFIDILAGHLGPFNFITTNMFWLAFYGIAVLALTIMYKFIPAVKVPLGSAIKAALLVGIAFVLLQYLYMGTQLIVTRLSAVYGALAFVPLLIIWMNLCWQVILFGAELTRGYTLASAKSQPV